MNCGLGTHNAYGVPIIKNSANAAIAKSAVRDDRVFTGYKLDLESALYYARARMYSAKMGRFVSRDPLKYVDGFSQYNAYFALNKLDPFGLECGECEKLNPNRACPSQPECVPDDDRITRAKNACRLALELAFMSMLSEAIGAANMVGGLGNNAVSKSLGGMAASSAGGAVPGAGMLPGASSSDPVEAATQAATEICSRPCCIGCHGPNPPPLPSTTAPPAVYPYPMFVPQNIDPGAMGLGMH
jgi:RHS repeat-associated protein